jgi:hypothetical protein
MIIVTRQMATVTFLDIDGQLGQRTLKAISVDRAAEFQWSRVHASLHLPQVCPNLLLNSSGVAFTRPCICLRSSGGLLRSGSLPALNSQDLICQHRNSPKHDHNPRRLVASGSVETSGNDFPLLRSAGPHPLSTYFDWIRKTKAGASRFCDFFEGLKYLQDLLQVIVLRSTWSLQVMGGFGTPHTNLLSFRSKLEFAPWGALVGTSKYLNSQDY